MCNDFSQSIWHHEERLNSSETLIKRRENCNANDGYSENYMETIWKLKSHEKFKSENTNIGSTPRDN